MAVTHNGTGDNATFNLTISELVVSGNTASVAVAETFNNLTTEPNTANNVIDTVNQGSRLVQLAMITTPTAAPWPRPRATGIMSGSLDPTRPVFADLSDITIALGTIGGGATSTAIPLTISPDPNPAPSQTERQTPASFLNWAQRLQAAIRNAAALQPAENQQYFLGATVAVLGDASTGNPRRFVITPGFGSRAFAADEIFVFGGADAANYGLLPPTATPQPGEQLPNAGAAYPLTNGRDGTVVDTSGIMSCRSRRFRATPQPAPASTRWRTWICSTSCASPTRRGSAYGLARSMASAELRRRAAGDDDRRHSRSGATIDQMQTWLAENETLAASQRSGLFPAHHHPRSAQPEPAAFVRFERHRSPGCGRAPTPHAASGRRRRAPMRGCAMSRASSTR